MQHIYELTLFGFFYYNVSRVSAKFNFEGMFSGATLTTRINPCD